MCRHCQFLGRCHVEVVGWWGRQMSGNQLDRLFFTLGQVSERQTLGFWEVSSHGRQLGWNSLRNHACKSRCRLFLQTVSRCFSCHGSPVSSKSWLARTQMLLCLCCSFLEVLCFPWTVPRTELILFLQNQPRHDSLRLLSFPEVADVMSAFSCQLVGVVVVGVGGLRVVNAYFPISRHVSLLPRFSERTCWRTRPEDTQTGCPFRWHWRSSRH